MFTGKMSRTKGTECEGIVLVIALVTIRDVGTRMESSKVLKWEKVNALLPLSLWLATRCLQKNCARVTARPYVARFHMPWMD